MWSECSKFSIIGKEKAAVLPVPVCACPIMSLSFFNSAGIVNLCIGVGDSYPFFDNTFKYPFHQALIP